jgi:hypothetical protein
MLSFVAVFLFGMLILIGLGRCRIARDPDAAEQFLVDRLRT